MMWQCHMSVLRHRFEGLSSLKITVDSHSAVRHKLAFPGTMKRAFSPLKFSKMLQQHLLAYMSSL